MSGSRPTSYCSSLCVIARQLLSVWGVANPVKIVCTHTERASWFAAAHLLLATFSDVDARDALGFCCSRTLCLHRVYCISFAGSNMLNYRPPGQASGGVHGIPQTAQGNAPTNYWVLWAPLPGEILRWRGDPWRALWKTTWGINRAITHCPVTLINTRVLCAHPAHSH